MSCTTRVIYLVVIAISVHAGPIDNNAIEDVDSTFSSSTLRKCAENKGIAGMFNCATMRAIKSIQTMSKQPVIEILPGVTFNSDPKESAREGKVIQQEDLPVDPRERMYVLFDLLIETTAGLFAGRSLKLELTPDSKHHLARALEEGRGKMKKMMMPMLMSIGSKMITIIPLAVGAVALLTTKALVVAKMALVLAAVAFFSNLSNSGALRLPSLSTFGGWGTNSIGHDYQSYGSSYYPTTNTLGGPGAYRRRSIDVANVDKDIKTAQDAAYWGQKQ